ncbi:MAG: hypothetical protein ACOYVK_18665 [Bacillota bacterium]
MNIFQVDRKTPMEAILDGIEIDIVKQEQRYVTLEFPVEMSNLERKGIIETIKKYYDIFILIKADIPRNTNIIEEYFSSGIHGVYFHGLTNHDGLEQFQIMGYAAELFYGGSVFAKCPEDKDMIEGLLKRKVIPVLSGQHEDFIEFIKTHPYFQRISSNLLKYIPALEQGAWTVTLKDRLKIKMLLEAINLRQKLMIKSVDDSFHSSGL